MPPPTGHSSPLSDQWVAFLILGGWRLFVELLCCGSLGLLQSPLTPQSSDDTAEPPPVLELGLKKTKTSIPSHLFTFFTFFTFFELFLQFFHMFHLFYILTFKKTPFLPLFKLLYFFKLFKNLFYFLHFSLFPFFEEFHLCTQHQKHHANDAEELERYGLFKKSKARITKLNALSPESVLGITSMSDKHVKSQETLHDERCKGS